MELPDDIEDIAADPERQDEIPYDASKPSDDGFRKGCTCGLVGPWAKIDDEHQDHCAIRKGQ